MVSSSLPWRGQSERGWVRTVPSWCAVVENLPPTGLIQSHLKLLYFVVSEWDWLRMRSALQHLAKAHPRSLPRTSASLCCCFGSVLLFCNKSWRALFFFYLCLSWNEPAGVISTSQVFSKTQIEIRFLWFERNASVSYRHFICKHLCQGRMGIAPTDLKRLTNKCSREGSGRAGNTQVCSSGLALNICYLNPLITGFGSHTNSVQVVPRK